MKKITFSFLICFLSILSYSQGTISFEASEGYSSGNINAQNGWVTTGCGTGCYIQNQVISSDYATDGVNSLKIVQETAFSGQSSPIVGAFYNYSSPVPNTMATFSADFYIDTFDSSTTSDYIFGLVNVTAGQFRTYVRFTFQGNISVLAGDGLGGATLADSGTDWTPLTWFNVRIELDGTNVEVFVNNASIYSGLAATAGSVEQVRFAHDNYVGFAYIDNFRTNDEQLSVSEFELKQLKHFYDTTSDVLTVSSSDSNIENIRIFNVLGQQVLITKSNDASESIDLSNLKNGIYIVNVSIENRSESFKFVKQ